MSGASDPSAPYLRARRATMWALLLMGAPVGALLPRLAEIKASIGASAGSFGTAVALGAIGAIIGNWSGSQLAHRFGTQPMAQGIFAVMMAANLGNALVPNAAEAD